MGESSQSQKITRKLEQYLDQCDVEHVFKGHVFGFDVVGSDTEERIIKGMLIDRKEGIRRVNFSSSETSTASMVSSTLRVGDSVTIIGIQHPQSPTATLPLVITFPDEQTLLFAKEPESIWWSRQNSSVYAGLYFLFLILCALYWLVSFSPDYSSYSGLVGMTVVAMFLLFIGIGMYRNRIGRVRVIRFDSEGWGHVINVVNNHYQLEI